MGKYLALLPLLQGNRRFLPGQYIHLDEATADILIRKRAAVLADEELDAEVLTDELARKLVPVCFAEDALESASKRFGIRPVQARSLAAKHGAEWCARRGGPREFIGKVTAEDIKAWQDG